MVKVSINENLCKGCGLCARACPKGCIELSKAKINAKGYHPAQLTDAERCTACASCATMCPDAVITVIRE